MKRIVPFIFLLPLAAFAQFTDDFTDGDFTSNPAWSGDDSIFIVNGSNQLQSNGFAQSDTAFLVTGFSSSFSDTITWEFYLNLLFSPSDNNRVSIFLCADNANLQGALNGYYIRIGENGSLDAIKLYRQSGAASTLILTGTGNIYATDPVARIKVIRDPSGNWTIFSDNTGGTNYILEGTATDNTFTSSQYFGVWCKYTSTNSKNFIFDDFNLTGSLFIDTIPPAISSLTLVSSTQVDILFSENVEQTSAQTLSNYSANNGIGNPSSALRDGSDLSLVHLTFGNTFGLGITNTLTVNAVQDLNGNGISNDTVSFVYYVAQPNDVVINEIMSDINPVPPALPAAEFVELFNRSGLSLSLNNWQFTDGTATIGILPNVTIQPDSFIILCAAANQSLLAPFGNTLGLSAWPALNDGGDNLILMNDAGDTIFYVSYSSAWYRDAVKDDGGWTLELIDAANDCFTGSNYRASIDTNGGTPGKINSVLGLLWDTVPPAISNLEILSSNSIRIYFSKEIDTISMNNVSNYSVDNGMGNPVNIIFASDLSYIELNLPANLDTGITYTLTIALLADCIGNTSVNATVKFSIPVAAERYDVLINEIFADPDPAVALPAEEFVELYNRSDKTIDLNNWKFTDGSTTATFSSFLLLPDSFVIITSNTNASLFVKYGKTMGVPSFPGLNNAGETLTLLDDAGTMIHTVSYEDSWYANDVKKDGGWTLEMIDVNSPCEGAVNWRASIDIKGGTPGKKNSIAANNPNVTPPALLKIVVIDSITLKLIFSKTMDDAVSVNTANFFIDNNAGNPLSAVILPPSFNTIILTLSNPIQSRTIYTLTVTGVKDCSGNTVGLDNSGKFGLPEAVNTLDIVINEILFNPKTSGYDFVEIYNRSDKIIDLSKMQLADLVQGTDSLASVYDIAQEGQLIFPQEYWVLSANPDNVKQNYYTPNPKKFIKMSMPSFNDDEGTAVLQDRNQSRIDQLHYYDSWQFSLIDNIGDVGVSLERIDFDKPTQDQNNWHSAASTVGFATPAYQNSQYSGSQPLADEVSVEPEVFSPDEDGKDDFLNIHYKTDENGMLGNVRIYDARGRLVRDLVKNQLLATQGTFTWDGLTDKGDKALIGIYVVYAEVFKPGNAKTRKYKKSCVVAGKL